VFLVNDKKRQDKESLCSNCVFVLKKMPNMSTISADMPRKQRHRKDDGQGPVS